jgi:hypothetical protein
MFISVSPEEPKADHMTRKSVTTSFDIFVIEADMRSA